MKRDNLRIRKGNKYTGEALDGLPHGKGTMTYPDGQAYVGEFKDGNCHGKGTLTNPNGCSYVGEFYENARTGHGTEIFPDGSKYVGEFKDNLPHGKGTMTYPDKGPENIYGRGTYEGEWKEGMQHGQGTLLYQDGTTSYVGQWKDEKWDGPGKWTTQFDISEGIFKEGELWEGNVYDPDDGNLEATYIDGVSHEVETTTDWRKVDEEDGSFFEGSYRKGKRNGFGLWIRWGRSQYAGDWKDDLFHGQGRYTHSMHSDESTYEGEWKEGERWEGTETDKDGSVTATYSEGVKTEK